MILLCLRFLVIVVNTYDINLYLNVNNIGYVRSGLSEESEPLFVSAQIMNMHGLSFLRISIGNSNCEST